MQRAGRERGAICYGNITMMFPFACNNLPGELKSTLQIVTQMSNLY